MGLLTEGNPLSWKETKKYTQHVREHGIIQFINLYRKLRDQQGDGMQWGDEIEYTIVKFFDEKKEVKLNLRVKELLPILQEKELADPINLRSIWRPEYAEYMIEGIPGQPFGNTLAGFNTVEANMKYRREELAQVLEPDEAVLTITTFPRLGCKNFTDPPTKPTPEKGLTQSLFYPDEALCQSHPRFKFLTTNTRGRRGEHFTINLPIFKDKNTKFPVDDSCKYRETALPDHVYLDTTGFGMGCCCLQVTMQACNIDEARHIYDQLTPLTAIMLALSAASPIHRGFLTDISCRTNNCSGGLDDRTQEERGLKPLKEDKCRIYKSRNSSIDSYLSPQGEKYNDIPIPYREEDYQKLVDNGVDHLLAQHIAHLFVRDTMLLLWERIHQNDEEEADHFESMQTTNWQSMRFKPPPLNSSIGWRVEFRPCELQLTDFENAAIVSFIVLVARVVLSYKLNLLMPISKVDENMQRAQKRNVIIEEKFWFRKNITTSDSPPEVNIYNSTSVMNGNAEDDDVCIEMTINEIMNGKKDEFPGLVALVKSYLNGMEVDDDTRYTLDKYLEFIKQRSSGEILTGAEWIRKFVLSHPDYKQDSKVSDLINYDLMKTILAIQNGEKSCPELLGKDPVTKTKENVPEPLINNNHC